MGSLSGWLFDRLTDASNGDMALATMITGRSVAHSRTTLHYSVLDSWSMTRRYRQALTGLLPGSTDLSPEGPWPTCEAPKCWTGARRVPRLKAMQRLFGRLRESIALGGVEGINALVAYTMLGFHLGTGARPVASRNFPFATDVPPVVVLTEKARSPYYKNPALLAKPVHEQMDKLIAALHACVPGWSAVRDSVFPRVGPNLSVLRPLHPMDLGATMLLHGFDIELYGIRRFLRSQLMDRGVDGEDIDALMGHWFDGASPWDPLSTYAPSRLFNLVNGPIADLLEEVGFFPVSFNG